MDVGLGGEVVFVLLFDPYGKKTAIGLRNKSFMEWGGSEGKVEVNLMGLVHDVFHAVNRMDLGHCRIDVFAKGGTFSSFRVSWTSLLRLNSDGSA